MVKKMRIWLIVGISLLVIGGIVFTVAMSLLGWEFARLSTANYQTNEYAVTEDFDSISVQAREADIRFLPSENGECKVVCVEKESVSHTVEVQNGKLVITTVGVEKWYENFFNFNQETLTVYLPKQGYTTLSIEGKTGDVEVSKEFSFENAQVATSTGDIRWYASASNRIALTASTGDITVENISASSLKLTVSTGRVSATGVNCTDGVDVQVSTGEAYLTNVACKSFVSGGGTGDITLKNVQAEERLSIERGTGDVRFDGCDSGEIVVKTGTGDIRGTLLSSKTFYASTSTGHVNVPQGTTGGNCTLKTTTGNIHITISA